MTVLIVFGQAVNVWLMWRYGRPIQAGSEGPVPPRKETDPSSALSP